MEPVPELQKWNGDAARGARGAAGRVDSQGRRRYRDVSKRGRVEARTRGRRVDRCRRRDLRGPRVRDGANRGDDRACGGEDPRRDQLRVGGDGQPDFSRKRLRWSAARIRLRRASNRASANNRGQLLQLQVRRTRSGRRDPGACIRRWRDEPRDDEPQRRRDGRRCTRRIPRTAWRHRAPGFAEVRRWPDSMPQYEVGHLARVAEIERVVAEIPAFAIAGAAYRGVGIPDCVRSGEDAADAIFAKLSTPK